MVRVTLPLLKKYVLPVVKTVGRELLKQALPELVDVATKKIKRRDRERGFSTKFSNDL